MQPKHLRKSEALSVGNPFNLPGELTDVDLARLYRLQVREQRDFALFAISPEGRMATWNRGAEHIFGYSEEEWLGQDTGLIFTEEDNRDAVPLREMESAKKEGMAANIRWHRRKDGTRIFLRGVLNAIHDTDGSVPFLAEV